MEISVALCQVIAVLDAGSFSLLSAGPICIYAKQFQHMGGLL